MDSSESVSRAIAFGKEHPLPIVLGFVGLIFFGYGLISLSDSSSEKDVLIETVDSSTEITTQSAKIQSLKTESIGVDVEGAVMNPGVITLPKGSRVQDALTAVGGLTNASNREWVAKHINLATKLSDGAKIYIPQQGEEITTSVLGLSTQDQSQSVNINTGMQAELENLPGIGAVTAQKIIQNRPYHTIEEVLSKKSVSKSVFEKIKDKITVD